MFGKIVGVIFGIIGIVVIFLAFPMLLDSTHSLQTNSYDESFAGVTTGAAVTTANVTLLQPLYLNEIIYVTNITSDNVSDTPSAEAYTAASQILQIKTLNPSTTRTLVVTYDIEALSTYTGMTEFVGMAPLLILLALFGIILGVTWYGLKERGGGSGYG